MKYHLDYGLRLHREPEYKNLYSWAINEVEADGRASGRDQIPWGWTLWFSAMSCNLIDQFEIFGRYSDNKDDPAVTSNQVIRMKLRPGMWRDEKFVEKVSYSIFGTKRSIQSFHLDVRPVDAEVITERCTAWASASYTHEIDFRQETVDDYLGFYLYVRPEKFARYVDLIDRRTVHDINFSVGSVAGFYSEWTPSISTGQIKVLLSESEHKIEGSLDSEIKPLRIGRVHDARLLMQTRLDLETSS